MHKTESSHDLVQVDHDLNDFQQRAVEHELSRSRLATLPGVLRASALSTARSIPAKVRRLPRRYALHTLLLVLVPTGLFVSRDAARPVEPKAPAVAAVASYAPQRPLLGVTIQSNRNEPVLATEQPAVGDAPLGEDALIVPVAMPEDLATAAPAAPANAQASVSADLANLRKGPKTEFDRIDKLTAGTGVTAVAYHEGWVQVQTEGGQAGWLALEVLDLDSAAAEQLPAPAELPILPPAKVATIVQDSLNLRDGPGTDYISLGKLGADSQVALLAQYDGWYQVETGKGTVGWVSQEFLGMQAGVAERVAVAESIPSSNPALVGYLSDSSVNLREGPNTKFGSQGKLAQGAELTLLASHGDWLKVQTAKGTKGWVAAELVDVSGFIRRRVPHTDNVPALPKPAPKPAAPKAKPAAPARPAGGGGVASGDVASMAWNYVGSPYVWGGESPRGFDCSGLTRFLYRQIGVSLPHSARGQYSSAYGSFVSLNSLQPGDLLFYANTAGPGITHVGIYVGNGTMVNATTPRGGVQAVNIYSSYWMSHYYGALRPYR